MNNINYSKIKFIKISYKKLNKILKQLKNKTYLEILYILKKLNILNKNINIIIKTLFLAINNLYYLNLKNKKILNKNNFKIIETYIIRGSILKRLICRAKGKSNIIKKKFNHLIIKISTK